MAQSDVLRAIKSLGGRASSEEIIEKAKEEFPERSLHSYVAMRLNSLERNGYVSKVEYAGNTVWEITEDGKNLPTREFGLDESLDSSCLSTLEHQGIQIVNTVSTLDVGTDVDLYNIDLKLSNVDYHPESDSHLSYFPENYPNVTVRIPSTGRITIAGPKTKDEILGSLDLLESDLQSIGEEVIISGENIQVQNLVGTLDIGRELELSSVVQDFDFGNMEYDPYNFPGIIIRPKTRGSISVFRTGKVTFVGVKTCSEMVELYEGLTGNIPIIRNESP